MGRKGVSDLISSILLIGMVIVIGVMITTFMQKYTSTEKERSACIMDTNYIIDGVTYEPESDMLRIKITNHGRLPVYGFKVYLYFDSTVDEFEVENVSQGGITEDSPLGREEETYLTVNLTQGPDFEELTEMVIKNEACPQVTTRTTKGIGF